MDSLAAQIIAAQATDQLEAFPLQDLFNDLQKRVEEMGFPDVQVAEIKVETKISRKLRQALDIPSDAKCVETKTVCLPMRYCYAGKDGRPICETIQNCEERCTRWEYET